MFPVRQVYLCIKGSRLGPEQIVGMAVAQCIKQARRVHVGAPQPRQQLRAVVDRSLLPQSQTRSPAEFSESCPVLRERQPCAGTPMRQHASASGSRLSPAEVPPVAGQRSPASPQHGSQGRQPLLRAPDFREATWAHPATPASPASQELAGPAGSIPVGAASPPQTAASTRQLGSAATQRRPNSLVAWLRAGQPAASPALPQPPARPDRLGGQQHSAMLPSSIRDPDAADYLPTAATAVPASDARSRPPAARACVVKEQAAFRAPDSDDCRWRHGQAHPSEEVTFDAPPTEAALSCRAPSVAASLQSSGAPESQPCCIRSPAQPGSAVARSLPADPRALTSVEISRASCSGAAASALTATHAQQRQQQQKTLLRVVPDSQRVQHPVLSSQPLQASSAPDASSPRMERAHCGVRVVWVSQESRRHGIAGRLLDAVR